MRRTEAHQRIRRQGPCAMCGHPYAAHRTIDTQMGAVIAGDHIETVADDYDTTVADMVSAWSALIDLLHDEIER